MPELPGIPVEEPLATIAVGEIPVVFPIGPAPAADLPPPVSVGSLVSRAFHVWWRNVWPFLGLGVMGFPMAGHLKTRGGHDVTVFNRTRKKADDWVARFGGRLAATPSAAAEDAEQQMMFSMKRVCEFFGLEWAALWRKSIKAPASLVPKHYFPGGSRR